MKKVIFILLLATMVSSCIEIEEHITINPDKSGVYRLSIDLSAISAFGGGQKNEDMKKLASFPQEVSAQLKDIEGISDINDKPIDKKGVHAISFRFKNPKAFHRALMTIAGWKLGFAIPKYIKINKHKVKKFNIAPLIKQKMKEESTKSLIPEMLYSSIYVNTIIDLPLPAKKVNHPKAQLSNGNKTVKLKTTLQEFIDGYDNGLRIRF